MMASSTCPRPSGEKFSTGDEPPGSAGGDFRRLPSSDPRVPLSNLSLLGRRVDSVRCFLSDSVDRHAGVGEAELWMVSAEISSAVQQIILNGAALLAAAASSPNDPAAAMPPSQIPVRPAELDPTAPASNSADPGTPMGGSDRAKPVDPSSDPARKSPAPMEHKDPAARDEGDGDCDIVEIDAVELLAEHVHFCDICGKGFKRDANLRMHMRAHGNRFKTLEALSKPDHRPEDPPAVLPPGRKTRFSCPFAGCNRNRAHRRFRPLKSAVCVKNHFRRSHCPKMYSCTRCNKKSFSVLADLKSHLKQCGECRWRCSCGTSFSRKDKLFGHMALFEGHMPAVIGTAVEDEEMEEEKGKGVVVDTAEEEEEAVGRGSGGDVDPEFLDDLMMDGFGMVDGTAWMDF